MFQILPSRDSEANMRVVLFQVSVEQVNINLPGFLADMIENYFVLVGWAS